MSASMAETRIQQSNSGPALIAKIEIAENDIQRLELDILNRESIIKHDVLLVGQVIEFIEQLSAPFGFLTKAAKRAQQSHAAKEGQEIKEENEGDIGNIHFHNFEVDLEKKFNVKIKPVINILDYKDYLEVPWAEWTKNVLIVYFVLTALSMIARPDFLSLVVISLGYFSLELPSYITRRTFRMLVLIALVSFLYDLVFLLFIRDSQAEDMEFQGMQVNINRFAYIFVWLSFLIRPVVILILWKDSREFRRIIRSKGGPSSVQSRADTEEMEL